MQGVTGMKNLRDLFQLRNDNQKSNHLAQSRDKSFPKKPPTQIKEQQQMLPLFNNLNSRPQSPQSIPVSPRPTNPPQSITNGFFTNNLYMKKDSNSQFQKVLSNILTKKQGSQDQKAGSTHVSPQHNNIQLSPICRNSALINPFNVQVQHFKDILQQSQRNLKSKSKQIVIQKEPIKFIGKMGIKDSMQSQISRKLKLEIQKQNVQEDVESTTIQLFKFHFIVGKGGFGKVWKVELNKTKQLFALKVMSKAKILSKKSVHSVMNERSLLSSLNHPLIANIHSSFQDKEYLYLVMDLLTGGDLRHHLGTIRWFSEIQTKFFIACIVQGLEYLHSNDIIHRDIKPENLVIDQQGFLRITDLGIARILRPDNNSDTSGTPGYMAPEVMFRQNHGTGVDFFAVGVIAYEFMIGKRPYLGRSRKEIRDAIVTKQVQIKKNEIPLGWTLEATDFINRMIQRKPINRLGYGGIEEVKQHPWFQSFQWEKLLDNSMTSPFNPSKMDENKEYQNPISTDNDSQDEMIQENRIALRRKSIQSQFDTYNYDPTLQLHSPQLKPTGSTNSTIIYPPFYERSSKHIHSVYSEKSSPLYKF